MRPTSLAGLSIVFPSITSTMWPIMTCDIFAPWEDFAALRRLGLLLLVLLVLSSILHLSFVLSACLILR